MRPKPDPELIDDENPEWADDDFERAVPFSALSPDLQEALASRPHQIVAEAQPGNVVPVLLSEEVVGPFRSTGPGWQERINLILSDWLVRHAADELPD